MAASYDPSLVALSVLISVLGAYAARELFERVRDARGRAWFAWFVGAATADAIGIWSMHYTGMMALRLPVPQLFDWPTVVLSLWMGILGSAAALLVLSRGPVGWLRALVASVFMGGVGISGLHYTGMVAMRLPGMHHQHASPALVVLSVALAVVLSFFALVLTFRFRDAGPGRRWHYHASAWVRGAANPVMHYTAMAAVLFTFTDEAPDLSHAVHIESLGILGNSVVPMMVLVVALLTTLVDRLRKQSALLDELFEQAPQAVALMTADNRVVRVNREFTRLFGYTPAEAVGRRIRELIVPDESQEEERRFADLVAQGPRVDVECVRRRKDGSRLHVALVRVPVSVPGGQVEIYAIYQDVTERKRAEAALREAAERLQTLSRRLLEVQEAERRHLARELHDAVGQTLTGLRFLLTLNGAVSASPAAARLQQAQGLVDELLKKVRGLSMDLRPASLDQLGLLPALHALFERYAEQTGVRVNFQQAGLERRFAPEVETAAYRVVQEALTNVARHAEVSEAAVRLWVDGDTLKIQVEDQGAGFDPEAALAAGRSSGLPGMRERVRLLGGRLDVTSAPGGGTHLLAELPAAGHAAPNVGEHFQRPGR